MRTFVSLDTETGIIRRYSEAAGMTHEAGLTSDPGDADATRRVVEGFRVHPHSDFRVTEQRQRRAAHEAQQLLITDRSHRDEA